MSETALPRPRNIDVDALRGWAITLVVLGHAIQVATPHFDQNVIFRLIYSFHMPLFMAISGYLAFGKVEGRFTRVLTRKAPQLLVPFACWAVISFLVSPVERSIGAARFAMQLLISPDYGLWFLPVLFLEFLFLSAVTSLAPKRHVIAFLLLGAIALKFTPTSVLGLGLAKMYFPYFAGGWAVRQMGIDRRFRASMWVGPVSLMVFLIAATFWTRTSPPSWLSHTDGRTQQLLWDVYRYGTATAGIAASSWLLPTLLAFQRSLRTALEWIGGRTIDVYATHGYFLTISTAAALILPRPAVIAVSFTVALSGALALSALVLRRFAITQRLLLGKT